jgi:hypothetical protein
MLIIAIGLCLSDYRLLSGISMPFWSGKDYLQSSGIRGLYVSLPATPHGLQAIDHVSLMAYVASCTLF